MDFQETFMKSFIGVGLFKMAATSTLLNTKIGEALSAVQMYRSAFMETQGHCSVKQKIR